ncbi:MAG: MFS transporter [Candidatus Gracilibacteria bacterium]
MNKQIITISVLNGIVRMLKTSLFFFWGIYFASIGLSGIEIGTFFSVNSFASIVTILPSGLSNDRFKSKTLISIALVMTAVFYFGMASTTSFPLLLILAVLTGVAYKIYDSSSDSLFYRTAETENFNKHLGIFQSLNYLTISLGTMLTGYIIGSNIDYKNIFIGVAIIFLLLAIIAIFILPKNSTTKFEIIHYKKDIFKKDVLIFLLVIILFATHFGVEGTSYGLFLKETLKLSSLQTGLYMGLAILPMAIRTLIISKKLKNWKAKNILIFGLLLSGFGHILMTIKIVEISLLFRTIHEIGDSAFFFFLYYGVSKIFSMDRIGGNTGMINFVSAIGGAVSSAFFGPIGEKFGYDIPIAVTGVTSLLAVIIVFSFVKYFDHKG